MLGTFPNPKALVKLANTKQTFDIAGRTGFFDACGQDEQNVAQRPFARLKTSDRAPTRTRLAAQVASRLNQLRDTNLTPR